MVYDKWGNRRASFRFKLKRAFEMYFTWQEISSYPTCIENFFICFKIPNALYSLKWLCFFNNFRVDYYFILVSIKNQPILHSFTVFLIKKKKKLQYHLFLIYYYYLVLTWVVKDQYRGILKKKKICIFISKSACSPVHLIN